MEIAAVNEHANAMESLALYFQEPKDYKIAEEQWNKLTAVEQQNLFDEMFIQSLQECDKLQNPVKSKLNHTNQNFSFFELPEDMPGASPLPSVFQPFLNLFQFTKDFNCVDLYNHIIERISQYLLIAITASDQSNFSIQTPSTTFTTNQICVSVIHLLETLHFLCACDPELKTSSAHVRLFEKTAETLAIIATHPEAHLLLFQSAVTALSVNGDADVSCWKYSNNDFRKKIIGLCLNGVQKIVHLDSFLYGEMVAQLLQFVVELQAVSEYLKKDVDLKEPTDDQVQQGLTECIKIMMESSCKSNSLGNQFFVNLGNLMECIGSRHTSFNGEQCLQLLLQYFQETDRHHSNQIPPDTYGIGKLDQHRDKILEAAKSMMENENTVGMAFHLLTWYLMNDALRLKHDKRIWNKFVDTPALVQLLLRYVRATIPLNHLSEDQFKYTKTAAIRCLLALNNCTSGYDSATWFPPSQDHSATENQINGIYKSLADLLTDKNYLVPVLENWKESDGFDQRQTRGCDDIEITEYILYQFVKSLKVMALAGGTIAEPTGNFLELFEYYFTQSRDRRQEADLPSHLLLTFGLLSKLIDLLEVLAKPKIPITTAVAPLKLYATLELMSHPDGNDLIKTAFPGASEYSEDVLYKLSDIHEGIASRVLHMMFVLLKDISEEIPDRKLLDRLVIGIRDLTKGIMSKLPVDFLEYVVQIAGVLFMILADESKKFVMDHLWPLVEKAINLEDKEGAHVVDVMDAIVAGWNSSLSPFPLIKTLMQALKNSRHWARPSIVAMLSQLQYATFESKEMQFLTDDMRTYWLDTLQALMQNSLSSTPEEHIFENFLELFRQIFRGQEHIFQELVSKNYPNVAQENVKDLFDLLMKREELMVTVQAISQTLGIPYNRMEKKKRKREVDLEEEENFQDYYDYEPVSPVYSPNSPVYSPASPVDPSE